MTTYPPTEADVIRLGIDMCRALEVCAKENIIHRDIKPSNIFVSEHGDYKLGDFGVARHLEASCRELSKKGTYDYMAPEVYRDSVYDARADIFSLGIVLYKLMNNGRIPFLPPAPGTHRLQRQRKRYQAAFMRRNAASAGQCQSCVRPSHSASLPRKSRCAVFFGHADA